jgi:hypothetical protein
MIKQNEIKVLLMANVHGGNLQMIKQNEIKVLLMANVHGGNLHHIYADTEILSARLLIILSMTR